MNLNKMHVLPALRVAFLAVCTAAVAVPMLAQDTPPSPPSQGQGGPGGPGRGNPERQLEMMAKQLNLTPDQVTQVKTIQTEGRSKMMAMRDDTSMSQDDKRAKMMSMRQEEQSKIRGILTEDQKAKYDAMMKDMQGRRGNGGYGGNGGAPPPPPPQI